MQTERSPVLTIEDAYAALREGDALTAETIAAQIADAVACGHGEGTPPHARALSGLANVLMGIRDLTRAAAVLRRAASVQGVDDQTIKDQLTYLMNLGEVLLYLGQLDEAEEVLRDGLLRRRSFYPDGHPGVAYGLEPLADLMLVRADGDEATLQEAAMLCDEAVAIFWNAGHAKVAQVLVLRAAIREALGEGPLFDRRFETLPENIAQDMIEATLSRGRLTRTPGPTHALLQGLRAAVIRRSGPDDFDLLRIVSMATNLARDAGLHPQRLEDLQWLRSVLEQRGDAEQAQVVTLALAQAASDMHAHAQCEAFYQEALQEADALAARYSPVASAQRSCVLRNYGLWLAERGRRDEAGQRLAAALDTPDPQSLGKAMVAYGIFLQHAGDIESAQKLLEAGVAALPPQDRDALCGRSHLDAVRSGGSCGCGDTVAALTSALRQIAAPDLPEGLVAEVRLDEQYNLQVTLAREPADGEMEQLERVLQQGMARLRKGIASGS